MKQPISETIRLNEWKIQQLPYFHVGDHVSFDDLGRKIVKVVKGIKQPALSFNEYDVWKVNNEDINENNDYYYLLEPDDSNLEFSNPYYELNIVWASESYIKKYKDISEIQRMQQLAGLNEWKINKPLYKIGQKLEMQWDQDNIYTITEIVKGEAIANRIGIEKETIYYSTENQNPDEEEKKGYYYKLKSVHLLPLQYYLQHPPMLWVSEKWIEKWIRKILNEWKIQQPFYKIGQKFEMWWNNVYTIVAIVKGETTANRIGEGVVIYSTMSPDEEEKKGYYYKLVSGTEKRERFRSVWVSEKWISTEIEVKVIKPLNERKIWLNEIRRGLFNYIKQQLPNMPEYVIKDMMLRSKGDIDQEYINQFKEVKWESKTNFPITMDIFTDNTKQELKKRIGGAIKQHVPKDSERHATQQNLLKSKGISNEPIILFKDKDGKYHLAEGWHRTIQYFKMYPEGYIQPKVWIGLNAPWIHNLQFRQS